MRMTVKQLKAALEHYPEDALILVASCKNIFRSHKMQRPFLGKRRKQNEDSKLTLSGIVNFL